MVRGMTSSVRLLGWVAAAAFAVTAAAQPSGVGQARLAAASAVPTDHYGPPACTANAKPPAKSDALERARTEQKDAAENSRIVLSDEPLANFGVERYKLVEYGECTGEGGCYWADLDAQYRRAEAELKREIASRPASDRQAGEKLAVVMDIDETTMTNWCEMRREDFGYVWSLYRPYELTGTAVAIPGALRLFNEAREAGVAVFFITGRPGKGDARAQTADASDETTATARNLEAQGFRGYTGLRLRNGDERQMATIAYKSQERQKIVADGYRIVMSLGDQWSDLLGDPQADVSVKLPNPFYFIP
ncbi:MAG TPA: HAD family acid phosphatase [Bryocella sp.]|nr:HAD family acid phosphatase [Bryocella sp.]